MTGTRTGFDLATDTRSLASSRAVVLALNGGSHVTRSLRPNGPSICTPEGGSGRAPCVEVRLCPSVSRGPGALSWEGSQEFGQLLLVPGALGVHDLHSRRVGDSKLSPFPMIL